jgi:lysophospholipase L1-like esterase
MTDVLRQPHALKDWERRLWLTLLCPVLWLQAKHVRRVTERLSEPTGHHRGVCGRGKLLRVLVAGDSGAAGVGVATQEQALCGQLVERLGKSHTVEWHLLAVNGLDSPGLIALLESAPAYRFDVVVLSMGANDVTNLCAPRRWLGFQNQLAELIHKRFKPGLLVHSAVPPVHACIALPQPLRWFLGRWAQEMNLLLAQALTSQKNRTMHWHPATTMATGLALDGIHLNASGYATWAESLSVHIL